MWHLSRRSWCQGKESFALPVYQRRVAGTTTSLYKFSIVGRSRKTLFDTIVVVVALENVRETEQALDLQAA